MFKFRPMIAAAALALSVVAAHAASVPNGTVYSADEGDGSISAIALRTGTVRTVPIPIVPHNVQISPDGKTLLAVGGLKQGSQEHGSAEAKAQAQQHGDSALLILDAGSLDLLETLPSGDHPAHVVTSPDGRLAYITNADANHLSVVDIGKKKIISEIPTGKSPHGLRLSPDGKNLYVANTDGNTVSVIDTKSLKETARIAVGKAPVQVAFTPDGEHVYVSLADENSVAVIDTATGKVATQIGVGRNPIQLYAAGSDKMYVANQGSAADPDNTVSVIDTKSRKVVATVVTGKGAHGVAASGDGAFVFVTNSVDDTVSAIDAATQEVTATWPIGPNPNGITFRSPR